MLKEGDKAPGFKLPSQDGKIIKLSDFKGKKIALCFYVRDFTPGCTNQACSMRDGSDKLKSNGIVILGISTDSIESHKKFADKYELPFTILSDVDTKIAKAYGVYGMKTFMGRKFMGVKRTTFLIDDVKHHADEVLEAFKVSKETN